MDKTEALNRLTALESEAANLRKILEAPEPAGSLLTKPVPGSGQDYFSLARNNGTCSTLRALACAAYKLDYPGGNLFQTEALAQAYAKAIDTMLLLRHQPGTEAASDGLQYVISTAIAATECSTTAERNKYVKMYRVSPCFTSIAYAEAAIKAVGSERILRMFKTFHHVS